MEAEINYYEHHIGDYDSDTAHLSWLEDMAYTRLIRLYYRKELPISCDVGDACRLVRAVSKEQRQAVESVLREFFTLRDDGWHQKRCDADVARFQAKAERNREVGKLGGRPRKVETQKEPPGLSVGSQKEPKQNPPQSPDPRPQTPAPEGQEKPPAPASPWLTVADLTADGLSTEVAVAWIAHRRTRKAKLTALAWRGFKAEVRKAGWQIEPAVLKAIARNWTAFEAEWVAKDSAGRAASPMTPDSKAARDAEARRILGFDTREVIDV